MFSDALATARDTLVGDDTTKIVLIDGLAMSLRRQGQLAEAEALYTEALVAWRRSAGDSAPGTLVAMNNLGGLLSERGRVDDAEAVYVEVVDTCRRVFGKGHPHALTAAHNLACVLVKQGRLDEAEPLMRDAVFGFLHLPAGHPGLQDSKAALRDLLRKKAERAQRVGARGRRA